MRVQPYLSAASNVAPSAERVPRNAAGISLSRWKSRRRHSAMSVLCRLKVLVSCINRPVRTRFTARNSFPAPGISLRGDLVDDVQQRLGGHFERPGEWTLLGRDEAQPDEGCHRENRQGGDLRPRHLQMYGGDRDLRHDPKDQKGCPFELVGMVAGEGEARLAQGVQLQHQVEPGPLYRRTAVPGR